MLNLSPLFVHSLNVKHFYLTIDITLTGVTISGHSGPSNNGNEGVLHISQSLVPIFYSII